MLTKENLINRLIEKLQLLEKLWEYHPDNPNGCDVVNLYNDTKDQIEFLQNQLNQYLNE